MFGKQMKSYCGKCSRGKGFWGWHEETSHEDNYIPKPRDNTHKKNSGTLQLQINDDMKKSLNTLTGVMGGTTDEYDPDL